jgi:hypothetical protein
LKVLEKSKKRNKVKRESQIRSIGHKRENEEIPSLYECEYTWKGKISNNNNNKLAVLTVSFLFSRFVSSQIEKKSCEARGELNTSAKRAFIY